MTLLSQPCEILPNRSSAERRAKALLALCSHLHLVVLPVGKGQGLDLADVGNVAVDPRAGQTDEHPQGAGAPAGICREDVRENKLILGIYELHG